ncbi:hypothetical protein KIPB_003463 [Kipferlia bialata]|uniref:Uncharacterized protein n=1 Tax=Kipferlia bialata TaxID=797122 RepID=A0A9K3GHG6_9EUKA|nr:hypothetical protein KIPB_003463 [Kipferlia bialata]|eukprot:g3463.t1
MHRFIRKAFMTEPSEPSFNQQSFDLALGKKDYGSVNVSCHVPVPLTNGSNPAVDVRIDNTQSYVPITGAKVQIFRHTVLKSEGLQVMWSRMLGSVNMHRGSIASGETHEERVYIPVKRQSQLKPTCNTSYIHNTYQIVVTSTSKGIDPVTLQCPATVEAEIPDMVQYRPNVKIDSEDKFPFVDYRGTVKIDDVPIAFPTAAKSTSLSPILTFEAKKLGGKAPFRRWQTRVFGLFQWSIRWYLSEKDLAANKQQYMVLLDQIRDIKPCSVECKAAPFGLVIATDRSTVEGGSEKTYSIGFGNRELRDDCLQAVKEAILAARLCEDGEEGDEGDSTADKQETVNDIMDDSETE